MLETQISTQERQICINDIFGTLHKTAIYGWISKFKVSMEVSWHNTSIYCFKISKTQILNSKKTPKSFWKSHSLASYNILHHIEPKYDYDYFIPNYAPGLYYYKPKMSAQNNKNWRHEGDFCDFTFSEKVPLTFQTIKTFTWRLQLKWFKKTNP